MTILLDGATCLISNSLPYTLGGPPFHVPPSREAPQQPTIYLKGCQHKDQLGVAK